MWEEDERADLAFRAHMFFNHATLINRAAVRGPLREGEHDDMPALCSLGNLSYRCASGLRSGNSKLQKIPEMVFLVLRHLAIPQCVSLSAVKRCKKIAYKPVGQGAGTALCFFPRLFCKAFKVTVRAFPI